MLNIFAKTFMTATRTDQRTHWDKPSLWTNGERFSDRRDAEIEAHLTGRRRD